MVVHPITSLTRACLMAPTKRINAAGFALACLALALGATAHNDNESKHQACGGHRMQEHEVTSIIIVIERFQPACKRALGEAGSLELLFDKLAAWRVSDSRQRVTLCRRARIMSPGGAKVHTFGARACSGGFQETGETWLSEPLEWRRERD